MVVQSPPDEAGTDAAAEMHTLVVRIWREPKPGPDFLARLRFSAGNSIEGSVVKTLTTPEQVVGAVQAWVDGVAGASGPSARPDAADVGSDD